MFWPSPTKEENLHCFVEKGSVASWHRNTISSNQRHCDQTGIHNTNPEFPRVSVKPWVAYPESRSGPEHTTGLPQLPSSGHLPATPLQMQEVSCRWAKFEVQVAGHDCELHEVTQDPPGAPAIPDSLAGGTQKENFEEGTILFSIGANSPSGNWIHP